MAEVKWIKMSTGLPGSRKIKQIRRLPDGDTIALMWVFLMCLAGDTNENGMVYFTPEIPYTDEMLAEEFDMDIVTVRLGLETFARFGMIEIVDDFICLSAWEKWQSVDKLSEIREYNRLAKQKSREKQRQMLLDNVNDKSMTSQPCQDTDIDKEKEEEKKQKKNIEYYPCDERLNSAFCDYIEMRKKIKSPMTDRAISLAMKKLQELSALPFSDMMDSDMAVKILEQSVMNSWKGLFPLKTDKKRDSVSEVDNWQ